MLLCCTPYAMPLAITRRVLFFMRRSYVSKRYRSLLGTNQCIYCCINFKCSKDAAGNYGKSVITYIKNDQQRTTYFLGPG
uniref:Uncharacterized protein n=1 Tax=Picea glauca TaxID=3330 RepID=A0A101M007_PICGL|nr:hypothetical protein ABT39_MTgene4490 [Picea glauca]